MNLRRSWPLGLALCSIGASPGMAQMWPGTPGVPACPVSVAFEPLGVQAVVPVTNAFHAVLVMGERGQQTAFEADPTGRAPNFGWLRAHGRDLGQAPLKAGSIVKAAGSNGMSCANLLTRLQGMVQTINAARLPYWPTPETKWDSVNSNSFTYWAVSRLNLTPPPPPNGLRSGQTPGYYGAISGQ